MQQAKPAKRKWLLVEDDISVRTMIVAMLDALWDDLDLLVFKDGYEAMSWLDKVEAGEAPEPHPELALLDIRMPGPDGHEIARRLRSLSATAKTPIVLMTAYRFADAERAGILKSARPDLFLNKPIPAPDELKSMLDELLAKQRNNDDKTASNKLENEAPQKPGGL